MLKEILKKYKIKQKDFAKFIGYTQQGLNRAIKDNNNQFLLKIALLVMVLEKKGVELQSIIDSLDN